MSDKKDRYTEKNWYENYFHNDYKYGPKTKSRNGYTWSKNKADDILRYCPKCKQVWEFTPFDKSFKYYEDFPSLGKKREECKKCENRNR